MRRLDIPAIQTERLRLRGHSTEDGALVRALWSDPEVTRYIGGKPLTREECWSRLLRYVGHWTLLGFGYWIVEEKTSGDFVGEVGFADYQRDIEPVLGPDPEVGWVLTPAKQGLGYATEAVQAVLDWGRVRFGPSAVTCLISPDNRPSLRVAQKCGFKTRQMGVYKGAATLILERLL